MAKTKSAIGPALKEIMELKELFERIKGDSEEFLQRSKALSETGAHEAKDLIEAVKTNWQAVVASFASGAGFGDLFGQGKKSGSQKSRGTTKKTAQKTTQKKTKKAAKKSSKKASKK
jgi:hypothetical protein